MLSEVRALRFLMERELISPGSVVLEDLVAIDVSRRNRNVKVISDGGPCYFLKQGIGRHAVRTVAREAVAYRLFQSRGEDGLSRYLITV